MGLEFLAPIVPAGSHIPDKIHIVQQRDALRQFVPFQHTDSFLLIMYIVVIFAVLGPNVLVKATLIGGLFQEFKIIVIAFFFEMNVF